MSLAHPDNPSQPLEFPAVWASEWGQDEIGLWMGFTYKGASYRFRWILPGKFKMGSEEGHDDEKPVHEVVITQGFWIGEATVSQALWRAVTYKEPSYFNGNDLPVDSVSWEDIEHFIGLLHQENQELKLCLPTEAQWEYSCRAGTHSEYFFGDKITHNQVHFDQPPDVGTLQVKGKPANAWGLYQMHGNVKEWCQDKFDKRYYHKSEKKDPSGPDELSDYRDRVLRGGSWGSSKEYSRSAYRDGRSPEFGSGNVGFRLARG